MKPRTFTENRCAMYIHTALCTTVALANLRQSGIREESRISLDSMSPVVAFPAYLHVCFSPSLAALSAGVAYRKTALPKTLHACMIAFCGDSFHLETGSMNAVWCCLTNQTLWS